jgi:DNA invertase Pin-like site-specific DNA recombinase
MANLGYARVSRNGQSLAGQLAELRAAGCVKIYIEKTKRQELAKLIRALKPADILIVTRVERLARSTCDLFNLLNAVAEREAGFRSLKDTWADTTTPYGRVVLSVLGGIAEFERKLILARTGEGRKRAQARGVIFGRPPSLTAHQRRAALQRLAAGETRADVARTYNVGPKTIGRLRPCDGVNVDAPRTQAADPPIHRDPRHQ